MSFRAKLRLQFFTHIWYFLISIPHSDRQIEIPMIPLVVALQASFICTNISCSAFSSSPSAYNGFLLHFFLPFLSLESKLFFTGDSSAWDISCFRNTSWLLTKWKFSVSYKCFRGKKSVFWCLKFLTASEFDQTSSASGSFYPCGGTTHFCMHITWCSSCTGSPLKIKINFLLSLLFP